MACRSYPSPQLTDWIFVEVGLTPMQTMHNTVYADNLLSPLGSSTFEGEEVSTQTVLSI
jgi:hypothetical protein